MKRFNKILHTDVIFWFLEIKRLESQVKLHIIVIKVRTMFHPHQISTLPFSLTRANILWTHPTNAKVWLMPLMKPRIHFTHTLYQTRKINANHKGPSIKYARKIFRKTNISNPLIRTRTCAYQEVRNVSFSENFAYVHNGWAPKKMV